MTDFDMFFLTQEDTPEYQHCFHLFDIHDDISSFCKIQDLDQLFANQQPTFNWESANYGNHLNVQQSKSIIPEQQESRHDHENVHQSSFAKNADENYLDLPMVQTSKICCGMSDSEGSQSDRKNNYISKTVFTQFKRLLKSNGSSYCSFFKYRPYNKNHVTLLDFEKIFSYIQNMKWTDTKQNTYQAKRAQFLSFLYANMSRLQLGAVKYESAKRIKQAKQYRFYLKLILQALEQGKNYIDRLRILYRGNKYLVFVKQIQEFIKVVKKGESDKL